MLSPVLDGASLPEVAPGVSWDLAVAVGADRGAAGRVAAVVEVWAAPRAAGREPRGVAEGGALRSSSASATRLKSAKVPKQSRRAHSKDRLFKGLSFEFVNAAAI